MAYDFDDDPARIQLDVVWDFLSTQAYWGRWRSREDVEQQIKASWRVVGCYERETGGLVGFARAVSDGVALAYLADVFVLPGHRGHGLGPEHRPPGRRGAAGLRFPLAAAHRRRARAVREVRVHRTGPDPDGAAALLRPVARSRR